MNRTATIGYENGKPVELSAHDICTLGQSILATRGAGKSWLGAVQAEQLIEAGYPVAILDVVGEYWSLRAKYPVIVFGGKHSDVPIDARLGRDVAHIVLDKKLQAVVDLTSLRRSDQPFFVADFCTELYEYGLMVKVPCWLLIEEAQNFVPQVGNPASKRPILDICEMGRHAGIGYCLISHRSATIDKTSLGLCDIIVFKRLTLPHDLDVVKDFFKAKDPQFSDTVKFLPGLSNEEALIYYPLRFKQPLRFNVAPRKTPHTAETPTLELKAVVETPELVTVSSELRKTFEELMRKKEVAVDKVAELQSRIEELEEEVEGRDERIETLEHDLELAQRFKIELPPELLRIPGFTEKVEYLEKRLISIYEREAEKARDLEEQVKALKAQLEAAGRLDFSEAVKRLEAIHEEISRSNKALTSLSETYGTALNKLGSALEPLKEFAKGFISKAEVEELRRIHEARIEALERAEDWRLNPSVIVRMSHIVNELNQLTDTGKAVLKVVATMDPSVRFSEDQIALAVGKSPSTARQYMRQLTSLGWIKQSGKEFQNNIDGNLAKKLREVQRPGQEPIPDVVVERCKKELHTFIRSL